ncbi:MAG TPA: Hsp33 family molecular chaperone HslO [Novosphingobium sp.]|nr:Hsp33 family molecular chaperone HslO [Novosphingobium sp.]
MTSAFDFSPEETWFDRPLGFSVPARHARGRVVRLGGVLDEVLSSHDYPPAIRHLLAEALVLTALIGSLAKEGDSQITIQAQAQKGDGAGIVDLLVCDCRGGEVRGYVRHDPDRLGPVGANPTLDALFGDAGYLAITFDLAASAERYQGIVPLTGSSLAQACESYFEQSEQIPTLLRVAIRSEGAHTVAGGLLVQHFPEGEEGRTRLHVKAAYPDWEHVAVLGGSIRHDELIDPGLSLESVVWRLFHEETVLVEPLTPLARGCRCTVEHYRKILSSFPESELAQMREDDGQIAVDCAFCSRVFRISL